MSQSDTSQNASHENPSRQNENLSHEEIARRFVDSKAIDFQAMGKLVAELGPALVLGDKGIHGVVFGKYNSIACMMPAADLARLVGNTRLSGLATMLTDDTVANAAER
jgi:hypothetical protein